MQLMMEYSTRASGSSKREGDSALRHRVRNLRAKVRLLLPGDVCNKHQRRTKNLKKMLSNKSLQDQGESTVWGHHHHDSAQLFMPNSADAQIHLFHKLSRAQIEQIMEDKLYYLGQNFVDTFDRFLQIKKSPSREAALEPPEPLEPQLKPKPSYLATDSSCSQPLGTRYREEKLSKKTLRLEDIHQKRKMMSEEAASWGRLIRARLKEREERRLRNREEACAAREGSIRRWNEANAVRTSQSMRVRQRRQEVGQMAELSQKLRSLCLQRYLPVQG